MTERLTEQQAAYNRALRDATATVAQRDAATPLDEETIAAILASPSGEMGVAKVRERHRKYAERAEDAATNLAYARTLSETQLGRPLTVHEFEAGFGTYGVGRSADWPLPEHRWWDTNPTLPCSTCAAGQRPRAPTMKVAREIPPAPDEEAERRRQRDALRGDAA